MYRPIVALGTAFLLFVSAPHRTHAQDGLRGVWRITHIVISGSQPMSNTNPQPNLLILTGHHYSRTELHTDRARPMLDNSATATADQLRAAWGPFYAEAGSYEVSGNTLTLHPEVAKNPAGMEGGAYSNNTFKVAGDTLWITTVRDQKGPVTQQVNLKLLRVEGK